MHSVRWEAEDQNLASVVPCARTSSRALYAKYEQAHASGGPWRTGTSTNQTGIHSRVARGEFEPAAAVGRACVEFVFPRGERAERSRGGICQWIFQADTESAARRDRRTWRTPRVRATAALATREQLG